MTLTSGKSHRVGAKRREDQRRETRKSEEEGS
jgi:hypothetical protein